MLDIRENSTNPPLLRSPRRLEIAVRALLAMDGASDARPMKLTAIGDGWSDAPKFLSIVLGQLVAADLVGSTRGSRGGYWPLCEASDLPVLDVVAAITEPASRPRPSADDHDATVALVIETHLAGALRHLKLEDLRYTL